MPAQCDLANACTKNLPAAVALVPGAAPFSPCAAVVCHTPQPTPPDDDDDDEDEEDDRGLGGGNIDPDDDEGEFDEDEDDEDDTLWA